MTTRLIAVVGATGIQGGSVIRAFFSDPSWTIRGITRDLKSNAVQRAKRDMPGVDWVQADLNDRQSLVAAFRGAYAVFGVTSAFDDSIESNREQETQQGINIAEAANEAKAAFLIWSTLPDTRRTSRGQFTTIKHTYLKADVATYINNRRSSHSLSIQPFFLLPGSYMQNYLYRFPPQRRDDEVVFSVPASGDVKLDVLNIDEWGQVIHSLLALTPAQSAAWVGKEVAVCGERLTGRQMAADYAEVTGEMARYERMSDDAFLQHAGNDSRAKELLEMFRYYDKFGLFGNGDYDLDAAKQLHKLSTFKEYLQSNGYRVGQENKSFQLRK